MNVGRDIVAADLRILFVAINPSASASNAAGPFATPTNGFWRSLHTSGFTQSPHRAARRTDAARRGSS